VIEERWPTNRAAGRPRFLKVAVAAAILDMSEVTLYRAIHAGEFPAIKVRGRYVIPSRALDEMEDAAVTSGTVVDAADWAESRGAA
jgi:excisionase family DNA binding protein